MPEETMRLFAAVPLSAPVREALKHWSLDHKGSLPFQKWTHPDDLHITLKFLGDTAPAQLNELRQLLQITASGAHPFSLKLSRFGSFGPPAAPSILWAGLTEAPEALSRIQRLIEDGASTLGFEKEDKPFRPHITMARRYAGLTRWSKETASKLQPPEPSEWVADRIVIYRSHLKRTPMYEEIASFAMG